MKSFPPASRPLFAAALSLSAFLALGQSAPAPAASSATPAPAEKPYKILQTTQIPAAGGIDYVTADSVNRRVFVACGNVVSAFDLDTYKLVGSLPNASGHGVALDPDNHTGLVSGTSAVLFNTQTMESIKSSIPARGADGYIFDPATHHFIILSHSAPNLRVFDSKDGTEVATVDAIGLDGKNAAVEQGASDGQGTLYFDCEDQGCIAVVDAKTLKVTGHYDLGEKGSGCAGLALDIKNHILFAMCRGSAAAGGPTCVILSAVDGKILATLPLAGSSDGGGFNPNTMEAFSSHGNGTLSIIKEKSPTQFVLEDTLQTKNGGKTCTVDTKLDHVIVITREAAPAPAAAAANASASAPAASAAPAMASASVSAAAGSAGAVASAPAASGRGGAARGAGGRGGPQGPQLLDVIFIGR